MTERLHRLLGGSETRWLVDRVRRRLERGRPLTGSVGLDAASTGQRRAIELLLGRRPASGGSLTVSLDELDRVLRSSGVAPEGLASAVEVLGGPIRDRAAERASESAVWRAAHAELDAVVAARPELTEWRGWLDSTGLVRRVVPDPTDARAVLDALARVLSRLPSPGVPIGRLAAETCGDAHALDDGRPVGTLALSAARALAGLPEGAASADLRRRAWAAVGVHLDELSSVVLSVGIPGDTRTTTGSMLAAARAAGEPCVLTLRQLRRHQGLPGVGPSGLVRICENPVVVAAAAEELGSSCPPLLCVNGRPSAAVWSLLELLAADDGTEFTYHGDFDWGGVAIAESVRDRIRWTPWRFDTMSYRTAPGSAALSGVPCPTPWDPALAEAMTSRAIRVEEELVLDDLLRDLGDG